MNDEHEFGLLSTYCSWLSNISTKLMDGIWESYTNIVHEWMKCVTNFDNPYAIGRLIGCASYMA